MDIVSSLELALLQKIARRKNDFRLYADELGKGLAGELDYTLEAANASEFMDVHSRFSFIRVPKVLPHLSRKRVLTMEWMVGESPTDLMTISTKDSVGHHSTNSETTK
nr:sll0005 isoform B [Ipomoea batatas]